MIKILKLQYLELRKTDVKHQYSLLPKDKKSSMHADIRNYTALS